MRIFLLCLHDLILGRDLPTISGESSLESIELCKAFFPEIYFFDRVKIKIGSTCILSEVVRIAFKKWDGTIAIFTLCYLKIPPHNPMFYHTTQYIQNSVGEQLYWSDTDSKSG